MVGTQWAGLLLHRHRLLLDLGAALGRRDARGLHHERRHPGRRPGSGISRVASPSRPVSRRVVAGEAVEVVGRDQRQVLTPAGNGARLEGHVADGKGLGQGDDVLHGGVRSPARQGRLVDRVTGILRAAAAIDLVEPVHLAAVDGRRLTLDAVVDARDHVGGGGQRDGLAGRQGAGGRPCAPRVLDAEGAEDVVETVVLLHEDHHVLDRRGKGDGRCPRRLRTRTRTQARGRRRGDGPDTQDDGGR